MLEIEGLVAGYDGAQVLRGVDLNVATGEAVCVIGANGAGKTTLMRCIAGLLRPTRGRLAWNGEPISKQTRVNAGIALVPEGRRVFAPMSVRENLEMGAFHRLWPRRDRHVASDMERVFALFPRLQERIAQPAGLLSGGEQQMLAIGRALMARPRLLLLDEPSMGLAPLVVRDIFAAIGGLSAEGLSVLLTEQNAQAALANTARGYVLAEGAMLHSARSAELRNDATIKAAYLGA